MAQPRDDDAGFVCEACGRWFADKDVKAWNTAWSEPDANGEKTLIQIMQKCPVCGEIRSYDPNESVLRGEFEGTDENRSIGNVSIDEV
jgi:hypothetical protein